VGGAGPLKKILKKKKKKKKNGFFSAPFLKPLQLVGGAGAIARQTRLARNSR
jgi:hypothetical protein